jgi:1,4-alpha-glucan branching enzyme
MNTTERHPFSDGLADRDPDPGGDPSRSIALTEARRSLHSVVFFCDAPQARNVSLIGDFNQWEPTAHPMVRQPDGQWTIRLDLQHGHYPYLFLVDGKPMLDPRAHGTVHEPNEWSDVASLISVS